MSVLHSWNQLPSASSQMEKEKIIIKFPFLPPPPPLSLLLRPDLQKKKTQSKQRLAEILRSEYASGMETGSAKVRKQNTRSGPSQPRGTARNPGPASAEGTD